MHGLVLGGIGAEAAKIWVVDGRRLVGVALSAAMIAAVAPSSAASTRGGASPTAGVVAVIGERGVNPLHVDFRLKDLSASLPTGMPRSVEVPLPRNGSFEERLRVLQDGPLGNLKPGVLYHLAGTRLLFVAAGSRSRSAVGSSSPGTVVVNARDLTGEHAELAHGTGVVGAAVSSRSGTAPRGFAVVVLGDADAAYGWVANHSWIDLSSMSAGTLNGDPCFAVREVRAVHASGRIPFAAVGNTEGSALIPVSAPNGMAEIYQVGGVDDTGRTWTPRPMTQDPLLGAIAPLRPYETGDNFFFDAPDYASLDGRHTFGGTSGATPRTAGRALTLLVAARQLLNDTHGGAEPSGRRARVKSGPLADGTLTRDELVDLLHRTAVPAEPASAGRHMIEGYGALNEASVKLALRVLRGQAALPERPQEDSAQERIDTVRNTLYGPGICR